MYYIKAGGVLFTIFATIVRLAGCSVDGIDPGEAAPALDIAEWIQGEPHDVTDGSHIYVLEFWRSTCPFCVAAIPDTTALQDDFTDCGVVVIAVTPEDAETERAFVEAQGEAIHYTIALDNNYNSVQSYGVTSVPIVFVIDSDGMIVWKGSPGSPALRQKLTDLCGL